MDLYTAYINLFFFGLVPYILMAIFGTLTLKNISASRRCIHPLRTNEVNLPTKIIQKRDRDMALLVLIEVIVSFVCTLPYSIDSLYSVLTSNIPNKSIERLQIESFLVFITMSFLLYLKYSTTFYVYMITSGFPVFANWRNSRGYIGENSLDFRQTDHSTPE